MKECELLLALLKMRWVDLEMEKRVCYIVVYLKNEEAYLIFLQMLHSPVIHHCVDYDLCTYSLRD